VEEDDVVGGPLGDTCACLAQKRDWLGLGNGASYTAYPHSLAAQAVAAGKLVVGHLEQPPPPGTDWVNATSLFQHHDFWKPTGGGDVTSEWLTGLT
jgi:hypothetical protein